MYPKLKFKLDIEYDEWTCREFLTFKEADIFSQSILIRHPKLQRLKDVEKEILKQAINKYVNDYYRKYGQELEYAREKAQKDWDLVSDAYFSEVAKLFKEHIWPEEGNYTCYISIFNCNPRFIKEKEFQAFYKHPSGVIYVCAHEMLHFMFYAYIQSKYQRDYERLGENGLWKLSEIFNDIILAKPEFTKITGEKKPDIYAETDTELEYYKILWNETVDIDAFLKRTLPRF